MKDKYNSDVILYLKKDSGLSYYAGSKEKLAPAFGPEHLPQILSGEVLFEHLTNDGRPVSYMGFSIDDYSGQPVGIVEVMQDRTHQIASLRTVQNTMILIAIAVLALGVYIAGLIARQVSSGLRSAVQNINKIAEGN